MKKKTVETLSFSQKYVLLYSAAFYFAANLKKQKYNRIRIKFIK